MGGIGSGRKPSEETIVKSQYEKKVPITSGPDSMFLPNLSGVKDIDDKIKVKGYTDGSILFVESELIQQDNANLFWDNTNNRLGIGTDSPILDLTIERSTTPEQVFLRTTGDTSSILGGIHFGNRDVDNYLASIYGTQDGATDSAFLSFHTEATGGAKAERMRITSAGNVGIGTTNPTHELTVAGDIHTTGFFTPGSSGELTISGGVVTATKSYHKIDTEGDAASDDLDTVNGGSDGDIIIMRQVNDARDVTWKDGTGNLILAGDFTPGNRRGFITLIYDSAIGWAELSRSSN